MLFADDAAHYEKASQRLINCFTHVCSEFELAINLLKTNIMGQDINSAPSISIGDLTIEVVENFTYLGSTISNNLRCRAEHTDQEGSNSNGSPGKEGLGLLHVNNQH